MSGLLDQSMIFLQTKVLGRVKICTISKINMLINQSTILMKCNEWID